VNEELALKSSLDLTLTQHPYDKDPEPQKVRACLVIDPLRVWYYVISPNSRTLMILLQVNPASGDEPKTIYEGCYETENTCIFTWSSILGIGHYRWLHGLIHRLPPNTRQTP
jgi:hypothetical protein